MEYPTQKILRIARTFPCLEKKLAGWNSPAFDPHKFFQMMSGASHGNPLSVCPSLSRRSRAKADVVKESRQFTPKCQLLASGQGMPWKNSFPNRASMATLKGSPRGIG